MSVSSEPCYECGRNIPDGWGEPLYACLWRLPGLGEERWDWVEVCPSCASRQRRDRVLLLGMVSLIVGALTALVAYPLLP